MKKVKYLLKETISHWSSHKASRMGAALSYYTIFSIAPLFVLIIGIAGIFISNSLIENNLLHYLNEIFGNNTGNFLQGLIVQKESLNLGTFGIISGVIIIIFGAIGMFSELNDSLDDLWCKEEKNNSNKKLTFFQSIKKLFKQKLGAISIIPIIGLLFLLSIIFSVIFNTLINHIPSLEHLSFILNIVSIIITYLLGTLLFALIYKILPDTKLPWIEIFTGAFLTSLLFLIGKFIITFYISHFLTTSLFGAASSLVAMMVWVYYSSQIFFIGASFIFVYSEKYGYLSKK